MVRSGRGVAGGTGAQLPLRGRRCRRCVAPPAALRAIFFRGRRLLARVVLRTAALRQCSRALSVLLRVHTSPRRHLGVCARFARVCVHYCYCHYPLFCHLPLRHYDNNKNHKQGSGLLGDDSNALKRRAERGAVGELGQLARRGE